MKIVLFGGTTEGRVLSRELADLGAAVTVCVATDYGREEQGTAPGVTVRTGHLDTDGMAAVLAGADLCIDATHPYAALATDNISAAAERVHVPCKRLLRPASMLPRNAVTVPDAEAAAAYLAQRPGNVLLTTGSQELYAFSGLGGKRLYPRVLPAAESLALCEAAGIPRRNIIAMQGPFSEELNLALIRQFNIRFLVTKDGGGPGGFEEKARAAEAAGVALIVLRRPGDRGEDHGAILNYCKELLS